MITNMTIQEFRDYMASGKPVIGKDRRIKYEKGYCYFYEP